MKARAGGAQRIQVPSDTSKYHEDGAYLWPKVGSVHLQKSGLSSTGSISVSPPCVFFHPTTVH